MRDPLTDEQCQAVVEVVMAEPNGWMPHPEYRPLADDLVERGTFSRRVIDGQTVYFASPEFLGAGALHAAMGEPSLN